MSTLSFILSPSLPDLLTQSPNSASKMQSPLKGHDGSMLAADTSTITTAQPGRNPTASGSWHDRWELGYPKTALTQLWPGLSSRTHREVLHLFCLILPHVGTIPHLITKTACQGKLRQSRRYSHHLFFCSGLCHAAKTFWIHDLLMKFSVRQLFWTLA